MTKKELADILSWTLRNADKDPKCNEAMTEARHWPGLRLARTRGTDVILTMKNDQAFQLKVSIPRKT